MLGLLDILLAYFFIIGAILAALGLSFSLRKYLFEWFSNQAPSKKWWWVLAGLFLATTLISFHLLPFQPRTQSDESLFLSLAHNMAYNNFSGNCQEGLFTGDGLNCIHEDHLFKAKAWPTLLSIFIPFFSESQNAVIFTQAIVWALSWIMVFLSIYTWIKSPVVALLTCCILFTQAPVLQQYTAGSSEPLLILLTATTLFALRFTLDKPSNRSLIWFGTITALWIQARQETFVAAPIVFLALLRIPEFRRSVKMKCTFFATFLFWSTPLILTLAYFRNFDLQSGNIPTRGHFIENLKIASTAIYAPPYQPLFAILGCLCILFLIIQSYFKPQQRRLVIVLFILLLPAFVILEHISGDITIRCNHRYALTWIPIFAFSIAFVFGNFSWVLNSFKHSVIAALTFWGIMFVSSYPTLKDDLPFHDEIYLQEFLELRQFLQSDSTNQKALFLSTRPSHLVGDGYSAIYLGSILRKDKPEYLSILRNWHGPKYFVWDVDCSGSVKSHEKIFSADLRAICVESAAKLNLSRNSISFRTFVLIPILDVKDL